MSQYEFVQKVADINWREWRARDLACLVFVIQDDSILLIRKKRGLGAGKINGPGGRLEPGESPAQAAVREAQEELCITPRDLTLCGENRFQFLDGYSIQVHNFTTERFDGEPTETDEATPIWFPLDQIPYDEMWVDDRLWLPLAIQGVRFSGRYIFDGDEMLDHELETDP